MLAEVVQTCSTALLQEDFVHFCCASAGPGGTGGKYHI